MPSEIDFGKSPPGGYLLTSARKGEEATIQILEFTSTEDGQHFVQRLEGLPNAILLKLKTSITPSQVDHMLAVIRRDGKATIYVNELQTMLTIRASKAMEKGAHVTTNDIVDVGRLELGVDVPDDAGVLFLFSVGWRKGLFYDLGPALGPERPRRTYDLADVLGRAHCHVQFQERFSISEPEWDALFASKWFPFAGLRHETIAKMIDHVRSDWDPDEMTEQIVAEVKDQVPRMLDSWRGHSPFKSHIEIIERAVERFQDGDFISCAGLLFPRIEGILRTHLNSLGAEVRPSYPNLTHSAVASKIDNEKSLLLPRRFEKYLNDVYLANFNPNEEDIAVSRHTVAHGVAEPSHFNQKSAVIGILVVHQLFYFLEPQENKESQL